MSYGEPVYSDEDLSRRLKTINKCSNRDCGELDIGKKLYCDTCTTAPKRKELAELNEKIKAENIAKGFLYA